MTQFEPVKRMKKKGTYKEQKICCLFCDIKDTCHLRARKEKYEDAGFMTYCPFTPNISKRKKK